MKNKSNEIRPNFQSLLRFTTVTITFASILLAIFDYNRFIQIPYWSLFIICYIFPNDSDLCSVNGMYEISKITMKLWNWDLEKIKPYETKEIPEMQSAMFSYERLKAVSNNFADPVVIRGMFTNSTAVKSWTFEHFKQNYGEDTSIVLNEGRPSVQYGYNASSKVAAYSQIMKASKMKLKTALRKMSEGERLYMSNVDTIFRRHNELLDQLNFTRLVHPWAYNPYFPYAAQIFLGFGSSNQSDTTGTMMHSAANANLFVQVRGTKNWRFIQPRYTIMLHNRLGANTPAAAVKYPSTDAPSLRTQLNEGDCLFNPPWMWHEIKNGPGFNIGVATRENHMPWILRNNALFSMLLELRATPRVAKIIIPKDQKIARFLAAAYNPCDEHDPQGCDSTLLDRAVYTDDITPLPYIED